MQFTIKSPMSREEVHEVQIEDYKPIYESMDPNVKTADEKLRKKLYARRRFLEIERLEAEELRLRKMGNRDQIEGGIKMAKGSALFKTKTGTEIVGELGDKDKENLIKRRPDDLTEPAYIFRSESEMKAMSISLL